MSHCTHCCPTRTPAGKVGQPRPVPIPMHRDSRFDLQDTESDYPEPIELFDVWVWATLVILFATVGFILYVLTRLTS